MLNFIVLIVARMHLKKGESFMGRKFISLVVQNVSGLQTQTPYESCFRFHDLIIDQMFLIASEVWFYTKLLDTTYFSFPLQFSFTFYSDIICWYCSSIGLFQGWKQNYLHTCGSCCKLFSNIAFASEFRTIIICNFGDDVAYQVNLWELVC